MPSRPEPPATLSELRELARRRPTARLAVVCAEDELALGAAAAALALGTVTPVLLGDPGRIEKAAPIGLLDRSVLIPARDADEAARLAAEAAGRGDVDILMKGSLRTDQLIRAALAGDANLRTDRLLSDLLLFEYLDGGEPRLVGVTDGGLVVAPTLADKRQIVENAAHVLRNLGFAVPKMALMSATEVVTEALPSTVDAKTLSEMAERGDLGECEVFGPLALDNALDPAAAAKKGIESPVAGHADCLVVPSIEAGNLLGKALTYIAGRECGHVVIGARVPILIPSRVESVEDKLNSIALGVISRADD